MNLLILNYRKVAGAILAMGCGGRHPLTCTNRIFMTKISYFMSSNQSDAMN